MNKQEIARLIAQAQQGDRQAFNTVVKIMQDNGYMKAISRYIYANRLLEPDDVKAEFWLGVVMALPKCKPDVGDPLFYLAWRGANRVKTELRRTLLREVVSACPKCGWRGHLRRKKGKYECPKCKNTELDSWERTKQQDVTSILIEERISKRTIKVVEETDLRMDIEYLETLLTPQEKKVFRCIVIDELDRDHEHNYLESIAYALQISAQCVSRYLKKIREKLLKIREE